MGIIYGTLDLPPRKENYEVIKRDIVARADVCIIGSGAAGAILARELVESGKSVVLLEKGGYYEERDMNQRDLDMFPLLWKNAGFNFDDNFKIAIAQGSCLGGSTIINDAVCFDTPRRVREEWSHLGVDFSEEEWQKGLARVNSRLHVTEVSDSELNRNSLMLKWAAEKAGLREGRKNFRNCLNCMQCGLCHLGCHYGTKQNVLVTYLHEALKQPDASIRIYCNCTVNKIIYNDGLVEGIEGTFHDSTGGESLRIRVNAKVVIISAGSISSSEILLKNGIAQKTAGKGICVHPSPFVLGEFEMEIKGNEGIPMPFTVHDFGVSRSSDQTRIEHDFSDGGEFLIESVFLSLFQFSMGVATDPATHSEILRKYNNYAMAGILVRDDNNGRLALTPNGTTSLKYSIGPKEVKVIAKGFEVVARMWFDLGAKRVIAAHSDKMILNDKSQIQELVDKVLEAPQNLVLASAHPQSGNRIGTNPDNSVVDANCRVHGFKNLFVCDASVFPTAVGVNPQISVMTVATIVAQRMMRNWDQFSANKVSESIGNTCSISQPTQCLRINLSELFDSINTKYGPEALVNSTADKPDEINWHFDPDTLMITNNLYWKGIFTRDQGIVNQLELYAGGFYKKFAKSSSSSGSGSGVQGITHPFMFDVYAKNIARDEHMADFGNVIVLQYQDAPYRNFYDVLKILDEHNLIGKAFMGMPKKGREILTFSMSRKYPFEFMTEIDHEMLYSKSRKPSLDSMVGVWDGYLVSDSGWTPPVFKFRYYLKDGGLHNDYIFGNILSGVATGIEREDHIEMQDETREFHDEIRQVNENILIGKYYSPSNKIMHLIPLNISFLHSDQERSRIYLPYVLKRVGQDSAYTGYAK